MIYSNWLDGNSEVTMGLSHKKCWNCGYRVTVAEASELDTCPNCRAKIIKGLMQAISETFNERINKQIQDDQDCKSCEYFDLAENVCLRDNSKGYDKGICLHNGCKQYEEGHWKPM